MKKIVIASTLLHLIDAYLIAKEYQDDYHLIYIGENNGFLDMIKNEFEDILILQDDKRSLFKKIIRRRENIKKIERKISEINPDEIIIGNDRRVESAWIKDYSYMDDGLYSYKLEKQYFFKYSIFEKVLREIIYAKKMQLPKFLGENAKKAYLFDIKNANKILKDKELIPLNLNHLKNLKLPKIDEDKIAILPHPKFINFKIPKNIAIKKHPRDENSYEGYKLLANLPFELILLSLKKGSVIYLSKNSTPYFLAKMIRDDLIYKDINEISL